MQLIKFLKLLSRLLFIAYLPSCTSNEIGESKDVNQEKIYQQYTIRQTEGEEKASVYAQFRFGGRNGTTLVLTPPSMLTLDGEPIKADSGKYAGAFYQLYKPVTGFYGVHHFIFTDYHNKKFDNDFSFGAFRLLNVPSEISKSKDLELPFETASFNEEDYIELSTTSTDSSFSLTHRPGEKNNTLIIPSKELLRQKTKEIMLETRLYRKIPMHQNTAEGGELQTIQTLKAVKIRLVD